MRRNTFVSVTPPCNTFVRRFPLMSWVMPRHHTEHGGGYGISRFSAAFFSHHFSLLSEYGIVMGQSHTSRAQLEHAYARQQRPRPDLPQIGDVPAISTSSPVIADAKVQGVDCLSFPELSLTGYQVQDLVSERHSGHPG